MIYIISNRAAALGLDKSVPAEILSALPRSFKPGENDQVYIDISGFSLADMKKAAGRLKKCSCFWGVIDPKGAAEDPASFFFEGASDYIGRTLVKSGVNKKRFASAYSWALENRDRKAAAQSGKAAGKEPQSGESQNPPTPVFGGWKSIRAGTSMPFFFLFVTLSGKANLRSLVGESIVSAVRTRLRDTLQQAFREADALLWMETEDNFLFLVPPAAALGALAVEAALKTIMNSRLIGIENLGLSFPVDFTFALHYGETMFHAPGKTGSVISEPVNYIFHLGTKKAESGRLSVSDSVREDTIPEGLRDLFSPAGIFEGAAIRHSRRFVYS